MMHSKIPLKAEKYYWARLRNNNEMHNLKPFASAPKAREKHMKIAGCKANTRIDRPLYYVEHDREFFYSER